MEYETERESRVKLRLPSFMP